MIKSRQALLQLNSVFAGHLISIQQAKYNLSGQWKEGDSVVLHHDEKAVVLTKEQADDLNKKDRDDYLQNCDHYSGKDLPVWEGRSTLISPEKEVRAYLSDLGGSLAEQTSAFGKMLVLGDWNTPWLNQENDYPPAARAIKYLARKMDKNFNGGLLLDKREISEFIPHLFWLIRCNASLPEFVIGYERSKTIFGICKYGVLHLEYYDDKEKKELLKCYQKKGFREIDRCFDPVTFDDFDGRRLKISD